MTEGLTTITLKPGDQYTLRLKGLGAAGYTWGFTIEGSVKVVQVTTEPMEHPPTSAPAGSPPNTGSVDQVYQITALVPGQTRIRFTQQRSWERDKPSLKEYTLEVNVAP